nr:hypothetical protein [Tanacetum cinerariifolium]
MVAYLEKSDDNTMFHQINTASFKTINFVKQIHAIVDVKVVVISESSVRSDLLFDDKDDETVHKEGSDSMERAITTDASLVAPQDSDNIIKTQTMTMPNVDIPQGMDTCGSPRCQETMGGTPAQTRVTAFENELSSTKAVYHKAFITLTKRVKKLETQLKQKRSRVVIHSSDKEEPSLDIEDSTKQGRMIREIDKDENVNLVSEQGEVHETAEPLKDDDDATLAETLLNIKRSTTKDKGKAKEIARQGQEKYNLEKALELQKQLDQRKEDVDKVLDEEIAIDAIPLATQPSVIVKYKIVKEGKISTYHIIRVDGSTKRYTSMIKLLENIDREDLETLWKLVKVKNWNTRPEEDFGRVLWGDIKFMFEPNIESEAWSPRRHETMGGTPAQTRSERVLEQPKEPPLSESHTSGSEEGRMEHIFKLMDTVPPTPHDSPLTGGYTPESNEDFSEPGEQTDSPIIALGAASAIWGPPLFKGPPPGDVSF